ncbi:MAG: NUDIX domain-containing protein [Dysgonamonadaceae bacterium]|jgi:8-oxo-dGTP pyrophosphatase MutT (NUDIX family)|nr:NUDIX domain-containing protein [Dysgonamonadaceae bacterium]
MSDHPLHLFRYCPKCGSGQFEIHDFKSKRCRSCDFVYYFNPSASTAAFITDDNGRLLVARRAKDPSAGTYDLPGGFVDMSETAEEAMRREILEETGLAIRNLRYSFSLPNIYVYSGFEVHTLDLFFEASIRSPVALTPADDVSELCFLEKSEIHPADFGLTSIRKAITVWLNRL